MRKSGWLAKYAEDPAEIRSFSMNKTFSGPIYTLMTPKPSIRVQRGKVAFDPPSWLRGASVFFVAGPRKVYYSVRNCNLVVGSHTVVFRLSSRPVADAPRPPPDRRRFGRYFETTTVISSLCSLITHTQDGIPFIVRIMAPKAP